MVRASTNFGIELDGLLERRQGGAALTERVGRGGGAKMQHGIAGTLLEFLTEERGRLIGVIPLERRPRLGRDYDGAVTRA